MRRLNRLSLVLLCTLLVLAHLACAQTRTRIQRRADESGVPPAETEVSVLVDDPIDEPAYQITWSAALPASTGAALVETGPGDLQLNEHWLRSIPELDDAKRKKDGVQLPWEPGRQVVVLSKYRGECVNLESWGFQKQAGSVKNISPDNATCIVFREKNCHRSILWGTNTSDTNVTLQIHWSNPIRPEDFPAVVDFRPNTTYGSWEDKIQSVQCYPNFEESLRNLTWAIGNATLAKEHASLSSSWSSSMGFLSTLRPELPPGTTAKSSTKRSTRQTSVLISTETSTTTRRASLVQAAATTEEEEDDDKMKTKNPLPVVNEDHHNVCRNGRCYRDVGGNEVAEDENGDDAWEEKIERWWKEKRERNWRMLHGIRMVDATTTRDAGTKATSAVGSDWEREYWEGQQRQ